VGIEPERSSGGGEGVVYRDGHFYKKDRRDKVSLPTTSSNTKISKATGKPQKLTVLDLGRSAMGKPNFCVTKLDGVNIGTVDIGTVDNALLNSNYDVPLQGGAGKGMAMEEKDRVQLLEKQLKIERERVEKLTRGFEEERCKMLREHGEENERSRREVEKLVQEKRGLEAKEKENEQEEMDEDIVDVFEIDENLVQPAPYCPA
jgi:hypothetical protein